MSESELGGKPSILSRFSGDLFHMAGWQKAMMAIAALVGGAGAAGQAYRGLQPHEPQAVDARPVDTSPGETNRNFVDPATAPPAQREAAPSAAQDESFFQQHSPVMTRIGLSFIVAYIIGWAFRIFVKTMLVISVLGCALLLGLSYFNVVNVDLSAAREKYSDSIAWVTGQAGKLRDGALNHLPSSGSGMMGLFVGLRRR